MRITATLFLSLFLAAGAQARQAKSAERQRTGYRYEVSIRNGGQKAVKSIDQERASSRG